MVDESPTWIALSPDSHAPISYAAAQTSIRIEDALLRTVFSHGDFTQEIVDILARELELTAATLFIRVRGLEAFKLKAASGFSYSDYASFLVPNPSYPSIACEQPQPVIVVAIPPFDPEIYHDSNLTKGRDISFLVVVPFTSPDGADADYPDPLGVLCFYASSGTDIDDLVSVSRTLQSLVGTLYVACLERLCSHLRSEAVTIAAFEKSLTETAEGLLALMCRELEFDAGAAWFLNPRRQQLQLRAVYPGLRKSAGQLGANVVRLDPTDLAPTNPLALTFVTLNKIHHPRPEGVDGGTRTYAPFDSGRIPEDFGSEFHNTLTVPLRTLKPIQLGHIAREAVGVLELTNKYTILGERKDHLPTTWEDLKLVSFMSEISTVLVFQGLQALDHEADYERRIHGLKINLVSARDTLRQLEQRGNLEMFLPSKLQYHLPNAIEWILEMEQQVGRGDKIDRLKVNPRTMTLQSAVAQAVRAARTSARARQVENFEIDADDILGRGRPVHHLLADARAFHTVLRNLFENSMKYRDKSNNSCRIELWAESDARGSTLLLYYADNGIGVPWLDRNQVFDNGFRGRIARRVNVQGEGIGLHECRLLMHAMKGEIDFATEVAADYSGAAFMLTFPTGRGSSFIQGERQ